MARALAASRMPDDLRRGPRDRLHDRRLRGRPARAHAVGRRRARGAGQDRPAGADRPPSSAALHGGPAAAPRPHARAGGGGHLAPRVRGRARPRARPTPSAWTSCRGARRRRSATALEQRARALRRVHASGSRPSAGTGSSRTGATRVRAGGGPARRAFRQPGRRPGGPRSPACRQARDPVAPGRPLARLRPRVGRFRAAPRARGRPRSASAIPAVRLHDGALARHRHAKEIGDRHREERPDSRTP